MSNKVLVCTFVRLSVCLPLVMWVLSSCGGGGGTNSSNPTLQSITVSPGTATLAAGLTQQFTAAGNYSNGTSQPLSDVSWAVSDATVAQVSGGLVTGLKQGTITLTATQGTLNGTARLTIGPPNLLSLNVAPQSATVSAGFSQQFTATGSFTDGSTSAVADTVTWSVSDTTVAKISATGLSTTLKQGSVTVTAASGSVTSSPASLNVGPPVPVSLAIAPANDHVIIGASASTKLSAILMYSDNSTSDVSASAAWSNSNPFTAAVDTTGNVTPARPGYTSVSATSGNFAANTGFTVLAEPRYLYFSSASSLLISKAIIDGNSGQLRMAGYTPSGLLNVIPIGETSVFPCPTSDPSNQFLYVGTVTTGNGGSIVGGEIQTYAIDAASGAVTPVAGSPFPAGAAAGCIDFEPTGKFGFTAVGVNNSTSLESYSRDASTGRLTLFGTTNLNAVPTRAAIDPLGQFLYVGTSVDFFKTTMGLGFSIDSSTGTLTPLQGSPFTLSPFGGTFTFHPSGNFVFMANTNGHSIDTYSVARPTGALTLSSTTPTCINPTPLRFSPDGDFAYTTCSVSTAGNPNSTSSLESFAVAANGALTHVGSTPTAYLVSDLTVDPSGEFLYLSSIMSYLQVATVGVNGAAGPVRSFGAQEMTSLSNVVIGGASPVKFTPKTAYITSAGDNTLSAYSVNADGSLTALAGTPISTAASPSSLSLWPWGNSLVFASAGMTPSINFFGISPTTGVPVSPASLSNVTSAGAAAIDPSGQFAFETDSTNSVVETYLQLSGGGWATANTPVAAGPGAGALVIDPAGRLIYVANQTGGSITGYQYWGSSPELFNNSAQPGGSSYPLNTNPLLMAIDPNESFLYAVCSDHTLRVFGINYYSGGQITQVYSQGLAVQPTGLTVEPTGRFLYTSDGAGVSAFSVDPQTGALTAVSLIPPITLSNTMGIYAEPAGQYLYVTTSAQSGPGAVYGYVIQSDGTLTSMPANPLANPNLPTSMTFSDDIR